MSETVQRKTSKVRFDIEAFTKYHWVVVVLSVLSGVNHLYLFWTEDYVPFLLAGVGFFGAILVLIVLPSYRKFLYPAVALFVLAQIGGYVAIGSAFDTPIWFDAIDKTAQALIVIILSGLTYQEWK